MTLKILHTKLNFFFDKLLISPTKLRIFTNKITKKQLIIAYFYLIKNINYKAAKILVKLFKYIISFLSKEQKNCNYFINEIIVTKNLTLKRLQPRAKGRSFKIERKYSSIKFKLSLSPILRTNINLAMDKFEEIFLIYSQKI